MVILSLSKTCSELLGVPFPGFNITVTIPGVRYIVNYSDRYHDLLRATLSEADGFRVEAYVSVIARNAYFHVSDVKRDAFAARWPRI